jgi:hypothetical protein
MKFIMVDTTASMSDTDLFFPRRLCLNTGKNPNRLHFLKYKISYTIDKNRSTKTCLTFSSLDDSNIAAKNIAFKLTGDPTL